MSYPSRRVVILPGVPPLPAELSSLLVDKAVDDPEPAVVVPIDPVVDCMLRHPAGKAATRSPETDPEILADLRVIG